MSLFRPLRVPFQDKSRWIKLRRFAEAGKIPAAGLAAGRPVLYDRDNNKILAPRKARKGDCVVGFLNKKPVIKQEDFQPLELNEDNVQAIFQRCLAKEGAAETVSSILYYKELGYEKEDLGVTFDKNALIANRKNIEYLYGQMASVHENQSILKEADFARTYSGHL